MLVTFVRIQTAVHVWLLQRGERGQTTAEYALVLLGAAAVALLLIAWATKSGKIGQLLNAVMDSIISRVA